MSEFMHTGECEGCGDFHRLNDEDDLCAECAEDEDNDDDDDDKEE